MNINIMEIIDILEKADQEHPEHKMTPEWYQGERHVKLTKGQLVFIMMVLETYQATMFGKKP